MKVFLSYASEQRAIAERIAVGLRQEDHTVFFDRDDLPPGEAFDARIRDAVGESDLVVFLISSDSVKSGAYALTELGFAKKRWEDPARRVLPVMAAPTPMDEVPGYLRSVGILQPEGDLVAEVLARADAIAAPRSKINPVLWTVLGCLLLVAVVAVAVIATRESEHPSVPDPTPIAIPPTVVGSESCVSVTDLSPNVIPHYLLNSIGSENFPYWLKIVAENNCDEDKLMTVRFENGRNINLRSPPQKSTIHLPEEGEPITKILTPEFDLSQPRTGSISIQWSIEDEDAKKLDADVIKTEILAPYTIAWDLQRPVDGGGDEPVDGGYLLASLQAWILKPPRPVAELGKACRIPLGGGRPLVMEAAIASCYQWLFWGEDPIHVTSEPIEFPAGERQVIRPHVHIVRERPVVSSLEAALLFAAVMEAEHIDAVEDDLMLLVAPVAGASDPDHDKTVFLAWPSTGGGWRAIDMSQANGKSFEDNVSVASERVASILELNSEIGEALEARGAGFSRNKRIAAVDFGRIPHEDRIRKLGIVSPE